MRILQRLDLWLLRHLGSSYLFARTDLSTKQRVRWVCAQLETPKLNILEAGCGSGIFSFFLAKMGHHVVAVDRAPLISKCARRYQALGDRLRGNIQFIAHDLRRLEQLSLVEVFDCVVCTEVIEHIINDTKLVGDLSRCLRSGGRLLLTTPNKSYHALFGDRISEIEDGGHVRKGYHPSDIEKIFAGCSLEAIKIEYLSGFFTQKLIDLERRVARTLGGTLAEAALYPFRLLSRFDRFVEFEPLCIAIVAEKR